MGAFLPALIGGVVSGAGAYFGGKNKQSQQNANLQNEYQFGLPQYKNFATQSAFRGSVLAGLARALGLDPKLLASMEAGPGIPDASKITSGVNPWDDALQGLFGGLTKGPGGPPTSSGKTPLQQILEKMFPGNSVESGSVMPGTGVPNVGFPDSPGIVGGPSGAGGASGASAATGVDATADPGLAAAENPNSLGAGFNWDPYAQGPAGQNGPYYQGQGGSNDISVFGGGGGPGGGDSITKEDY